MQPFTTVSGPAAPLMMENVDTDVIIRIDRLAEIAPDQLGPYAFEALRYDASGSETIDCVFNQRAYQGAPILLAGTNFGCGSSREGAVWALSGMGVRCVIAPSFGGIFANNCFQNGVLPITLPGETVAQLAAIAADDPTAPITVDLERQVVVPPNGNPIKFEIDGLRREALLRGLDELGMTLESSAEIDAYQARDRIARPWVYAGLGQVRL